MSGGCDFKHEESDSRSDYWKKVHRIAELERKLEHVLSITNIQCTEINRQMKQLAERDAQIKVAIEAFKQQCKPMYAEGGLARCLQDIATEALKQIGAGE